MCKNMLINSGNKSEDFSVEILDVESSSYIKGDIDELIFPDDEPHYISER